MGAALVAGALILSGCSAGSSGASSGSSGASKKSGPTELVLGNAGDIASWDPSAMKEGAIIDYADAVYDPLLRKSPDAKIEGNLATKWEYNDTLTVLTLALKTGVKFSDGAAFDGAAVKANLEARKAGSGSASEAAKSITSIDVVDANTVKLNLSAPNPALLSALATYAGFMVSPASIAAGTAAKTPVGSGPYTLDTAKSATGTMYTFAKKADYWNPDAFPFDTVVIKPITDFTAAFNALSTGQIQFMYATADMVDKAKAAGLTVQTVPGEWQGIILQDRAGTLVPALKNVKVRQAINYALDRETILKTFYNGLGQVSTQTFNPASEAWDESLNTKYPYDPGKAKALLAEAGYPNGFDLPITYSNGFMTPLVPIVSQYLSDVGIKVVPTAIAGFANGGLQTLTGSPAFMLSFSTNIPAWTDVLNKLTPTSLWNNFKYTDPTVTQLLTDIPLNQGEKQAALYKQLNAHIVDEAWFAPIATLKNVYLSSPKIKVTMQRAQLIPSLRYFAPAA
jgi:peptide/nickel transport system substrate-binding protein